VIDPKENTIISSPRGFLEQVVGILLGEGDERFRLSEHIQHLDENVGGPTWNKTRDFCAGDKRGATDVGDVNGGVVGQSDGMKQGFGGAVASRCQSVVSA